MIGKYEDLSRKERSDLVGVAPAPVAEPVLVPVAVGELIDKITILEIKAKRIGNSAKRRNVDFELRQLRGVRARQVGSSPALGSLAARLKEVNDALWRIEDDLRDCERRSDFGPGFIALARAVYRKNDERARLKRKINELTGSGIVEEKSYSSY